MKTVIEMAREAGFEARRGWGLLDHVPEDVFAATVSITREIHCFAELVRADEREQGQKWFDAVTAQHKQLILAEREACANLVFHSPPSDEYESPLMAVYNAIRARSNT